MYSRIKEWFYTRKLLSIQEFAHHHKNYLVIVCDPKDDTMFMSFRDKNVCGKIKSQDGIDHRVVKNVLKHSTFEREVDRILGGIVDALTVKADRCRECKQVIHTPSQWANSFYSFIDGALFNISRALRKNK